MNQPIQFGHPTGSYKERKTVYGVILDHNDRILVVEVNNVYHLVGGGIDANEDPEQALKREAVEEAGSTITHLFYLGRANQYYKMTKEGPMNKQAVFFRANLAEFHPKLGIESDHIPKLITTEEIQNSTMADFQKWAVAQASKDRHID